MKHSFEELPIELYFVIFDQLKRGSAVDYHSLYQFMLTNKLHAKIVNEYFIQKMNTALTDFAEKYRYEAQAVREYLFNRQLPFNPSIFEDIKALHEIHTIIPQMEPFNRITIATNRHLHFKIALPSYAMEEKLIKKFLPLLACIAISWLSNLLSTRQMLGFFMLIMVLINMLIVKYERRFKSFSIDNMDFKNYENVLYKNITLFSEKISTEGLFSLWLLGLLNFNTFFLIFSFNTVINNLLLFLGHYYELDVRAMNNVTQAAKELFVPITNAHESTQDDDKKCSR